MKKFLLVFLLMISFHGYSMECRYPLTCVKKASEICTEQNLKLFGKDECVECGCHKNARLVEKDGKKTCCGTGDYEGFVLSPSGDVSLDIPFCGCPMKGEPKEVNGEKICCGIGVNKGKSFDWFMSAYISDAKCGCPTVDGKTGTAGANSKTCCLAGNAYNSSTGKYDQVNAQCGCPEENGQKGTKGINDPDVCCLNNKYYDEQAKSYKEFSSACGCPTVGGKTGTLGTDSETCCLDGHAYNGAMGSYSGTSSSCCPSGGENKEGSCCRNGKIYNEETGEYDKVDARCGCPEINGVRGDAGLDGITCCSGRKAYNGTNAYDQVSAQCGCPEVNEVRGYSGLDGITCCLDGKAWGGSSYDKETETCVPCSDEDYEARRCCKRLRRLIQTSSGNLCCRGTVPKCKPEEGVLIETESFGKNNCNCGCKTDDDCNTDVSPVVKLFRKKRLCQDGACVPSAQCFNVGDISVVIKDTDNGRLTVDSLKPAFEKLKGQLHLEAGEKVTVTFTSMDCSIGGYSQVGDAKNIYVNSIHCCQQGEDTLSCEGIIVHEDDHRHDNAKQPKWREFKTMLVHAYQDILREIVAHADGDLTNLRNLYKRCYPKTNGDIQSLCLLYPGSKGCDDCMKGIFGAPYAKKYCNLENAKRYYKDPSYFDSKNCNGLRGQLEKDYINSTFARSVYIEGYGQAMKNACAAKMSVDTEEALKKDIETIKSLLKCNNWTENTGITDLPALLAELYAQNNRLCMSPSEFASCRNMNLGLSGIATCALMHDFLAGNPEGIPTELPKQCCLPEEFTLSD